MKKLPTEHKNLYSSYINLKAVICFVNYQNENMWSRYKSEVVVPVVTVVVVFDEGTIFKYLFIKSKKKTKL